AARRAGGHDEMIECADLLEEGAHGRLALPVDVVRFHPVDVRLVDAATADDDLRALRREELRRGEPRPGRAAEHDGALAFQRAHSFPFMMKVKSRPCPPTIARWIQSIATFSSTLALR